MLFVHEAPRVAGREAERFEGLYRDGRAATFAKSSDVRLLWVMDQAPLRHGVGVRVRDLVAAFVPRYGSGRQNEIVLWQRIGQLLLLNSR